MLYRVLALIATALFSLPALAAPSPEPIHEGFDYTILDPAQPIATGAKLEVTEFFWYKCPHCFHAEPALNHWLKTLPKDAQIRRVPAVFSDSWGITAKLYFAFEQMGMLATMHEKVFEAFHVEHLDLDDPKVLAKWLETQKVDRARFMAAYASFTTQVKVTTAKRMTTDYAISGVPTFIVDGKYATSPALTGSEARMFETLDQLIEKARAERAGVKPLRLKK